MNESTDNEPFNDADIVALIQAVGARVRPSPHQTEEAWGQAHAAWREVVDRRRNRRWFAISGLAASVAITCLAVTLTLTHHDVPAERVGMIARIDGVLEVSMDGGEHWRTIAAGAPVLAGETLRTGDSGRAALTLGNQESLRLDARSIVTLTAVGVVTLAEGAIYVDIDPALGPSPLKIETRFGTVRHLGTQYEVRAMPGVVAVSVREGRVAISSTSGQYGASKGEELRLGADGLDARTLVPTEDARWEWTMQIAPSFAIERRPLSQFLDWVARETGKQIEYSSPEVRESAEHLILRGSVSGLTPETALAAVLATTPLKASISSSTIRIQHTP